VTNQSSLERELASEQEYVDVVFNHLRLAVTSAKGLAAESQARFTADRETWMREENSTALFERDAFSFLAARRMADLDSEHEGLVFGRLDFLDTEKRYIGRLGVRTNDYDPLVIDWRAQAAEPFYRATPVEPMDVVRRRVLSSRDDTVTGIEDDVLIPHQIPEDMTVIGDGALMKALDRKRGATMADIVATIQAEQDEVIRAPHQGYTLITGGPGTGKTVVGLHRIAFLMYTHRRRFTNGGVLVIGPSSVFIDYIEKVLPSLGEETVTLLPIGHIAHDVLGFSSSRRDKDDAWVIKGDTAMVELLTNVVAHPPQETQVLHVIVKGEVLTVDVEQLTRIRRDALSRHPYNQGRDMAETQIIDALWHQASGLGLTQDHKEFDDLVRSSWAFTPYMDSWWPLLTPTETLARLCDPTLVTSLSSLSGDQAAILSASINKDEPTIGDIPLLDELAQQLGPIPIKEDHDSVVFADNIDEVVTISDRLTDHRHHEEGTPHTTYAHILVDEAQDITPMQWRMIHRRGSQASWTVVGDPAQSSWPDREEPLRVLNSLIGNREQRTYHLTTNYRSPQEAYDLATAYITSKEPNCDIPQPVRSTGIEPRLLVSPSHDLGSTMASEVDRLLEEVEGTIGIICEQPYQDLVRTALPVSNRVTQLDPLNSKGLEFDAVIVVDPDGIVSSSIAGPRILYVALTRPTQILVTIDIDRTGQWRASLP